VAIRADISERKRVTEELERHRHHLEEIVAERTAKLEAANHRLAMSDRRLSAMFAISQQANNLDERELLQLGIEEAVKLTNSEIGYLHFVNEDQQTIALYTWSRGHAQALHRRLRQSLPGIRRRHVGRHRALQAASRAQRLPVHAEPAGLSRAAMPTWSATSACRWWRTAWCAC
jgi:nitrate/nitrite-specific signal transduction histidine kinase